MPRAIRRRSTKTSFPRDDKSIGVMLLLYHHPFGFKAKFLLDSLGRNLSRCLPVERPELNWTLAQTLATFRPTYRPTMMTKILSRHKIEVLDTVATRR